jgi:uncharacterized cupin superfamily protein
MNFAGRREETSFPQRTRQHPDSQKPFHFVPKGNGFVHDLMGGSLKLEDLTHGANAKELEAVVATAEPGVSCWEREVTSGGKWYYILEGKLEVLVNDTSYVLSEGDCIYLGPTDSHIWRNVTDKPAKALMVSSSLF